MGARVVLAVYDTDVRNALSCCNLAPYPHQVKLVPTCDWPGMIRRRSLLASSTNTGCKFAGKATPTTTPKTGNHIVTRNMGACQKARLHEYLVPICYVSTSAVAERQTAEGTCARIIEEHIRHLRHCGGPDVCG